MSDEGQAAMSSLALRERALNAADRIPGWMERGELGWLIEHAAERERIVEVGSYQGRSTKAMAMVTPGVLYSVDPLVGEIDDPPNEAGAGAMQGSRLDARFRKHLAREIKVGKVKVIRNPSPDAAKRFRDGSLDMVFIDGNHRYPNPLADIQAWRPKLRGGGLLCGHDAPDPGVAQSLEELGIGGRGPYGIWVDG